MNRRLIALRARVYTKLPFDGDGLFTHDVVRFFLATLIGGIGIGLILSLFVVYFAEARHFPIILTGLFLSWEAVIGLACGPVYGTLIDKFGPSRIVMISLPMVALSTFLLGIVNSEWLAFAVITGVALFGAGSWSCFSVLLVRIVHPDLRQHAFGVNFLTLNFAIGIGSLIGPSLANIHKVWTFSWIYAASGVLTLGQAVLLATLNKRGGTAERTERTEAESHDGWITVLRDRRLRRYLLFSAIFMVCGYGSIEAGIPLFVTTVDHQSLHVVGLMFFFNTTTIVLAQITVMGRMHGKSRSMLLGLVGALWGLSWIFATSSVFIGVVWGAAALCFGQVVFALGETVFSPVSPALVNDLASEHLRGRYNAVAGALWGIAGTIGPAIATLFIQFHLGVLWTLIMAGGAILGGAGITTLRHSLTPEEDGRVPLVAAPE